MVLLGNVGPHRFEAGGDHGVVGVGGVLKDVLKLSLGVRADREVRLDYGVHLCRVCKKEREIENLQKLIFSTTKLKRN